MRLIKCLPLLTSLVIVAVLEVPSSFAQAPSGLPPPPAPSPIDIKRELSPSGADAVPRDASTAIFDAYKKYEIVAVGAGHGNQNLDAFLLALLADPKFPGEIRDVVVECGNSRYQKTLDRYIAGENVAQADIQKVWRNTTQPMCAISSFYEQLFPLLRRLNASLPTEKRVRVLAGDVPINWEAIHDTDDLDKSPQDRDAEIASIIETQVLSKHRKALLLFGTTHLLHGKRSPTVDPSAVGIYEERYPGITWVIGDHDGFGFGTPYESLNDLFEARLSSWKVPSIVEKLKGTWLADLLDTENSSELISVITPRKGGGTNVRTVVQKSGRPYTSTIDGYLYLGPRRMLLQEPASATALLDKDFVEEMRRRAKLMGGGSISEQADPDEVAKQPYRAFLYDSLPTKARQ